MKAQTLNRHTTMIQFLDFITGKYGVPGFVSGISFFLITKMHFLFTDDNLKAIGGLGLILSGMVAGLTVVTLCLKLWDDLRGRYVNWKKKKY